MKKTALYTLIGAVGVSALLAVAALLSGEFGELQGKTIATSLTLAGVSVVILACGAAAEKGRGALYVPIGIGAALLGGLIAVVGIWGDLTNETLGKLLLTCIVTAGFCSIGALLEAANLLPNHRWVRTATIACSVLVSLMLLGLIWIDDFHRAVPWRWLAVFAVLGSAGTITTLVLARIGRDQYEHPSAAGTRAMPVCPHCGGVLPDSMRKIFS